MLKINRSTYSVTGKTVTLDNTVVSPEDKERAAKLAEEKKRREEDERRAAEENAMYEAEVSRRMNKIITQKVSEAEALAGKLIADAKSEAERLRNDSRAEAMSVMNKASEDSENIREQARKEGYADGYAAGQETAVKKCRSYIDAAAAFLEEINSHKEEYYISNETEIIDTIFTAAEKIVLTQLDRDDRLIERIIAQAARSFRNSDYVKISVIDGEVSKEMRTDRDFIKEIVSYIPEIDVEYLSAEDNPAGTVILDSGSEVVDASVPTQLEFLKEIMKNSRSGE